MIRATVLFLSQLLRINTPHAPLHGKGPLGLHLGLSVLFGTLPLPEKQCPPYFQEPGPQMAKTPATPPLGIPSHFPHPTPHSLNPPLSSQLPPGQRRTLGSLHVSFAFFSGHLIIKDCTISSWLQERRKWPFFFLLLTTSISLWPSYHLPWFYPSVYSTVFFQLKIQHADLLRRG